MATLIKHNGETSIVTPADGVAFTLEELQGFVGGYIESVHLADNKVMFLNEDGKLKDDLKNKVNRMGTLLLMEAGGIPGDYVVGDIIICERKEI